MEYSKQEFSLINMLYCLKKFIRLHSYLSTMATFFCPQGVEIFLM